MLIQLGISSEKMRDSTARLETLRQTYILIQRIKVTSIFCILALFLHISLTFLLATTAQHWLPAFHHCLSLLQVSYHQAHDGKLMFHCQLISHVKLLNIYRNQVPCKPLFFKSDQLSKGLHQKQRDCFYDFVLKES